MVLLGIGFAFLIMKIAAKMSLVQEVPATARCEISITTSILSSNIEEQLYVLDVIFRRKFESRSTSD